MALLRPLTRLPQPSLRGACALAVLTGFAGLVSARGPLSPGSMGTLIALVGLTQVALRWRRERLLPGELRMLALFALLPAAWALNLALTGGDAARLAEPSRLLVGALIYLALSRIGLDPRHLFWGAVAGAVAAAALAAHQLAVLGLPRAQGPMNAIPFGNGALLLGLLALAGWRCLHAARLPPAATPATVLALAAALYAAWASGTRGGLLALPALLWLLLSNTAAPRTAAAATQRWLVGALTLVAVALIALHPRTAAELDALRVLWRSPPQALAAMELSSIGMRVHLYHIGLEAFAAHPWLGIGVGRLGEHLAAGVADGTVNPAVAHFSHLHTILIDTAARSGLVGLAALTAFVGGLALHFGRALRAATEPGVRYFALAGLLANVGAVLFALTNTLFPAIAGTNALVLSLAVPAGALAHRLRPPATTS